MQRKMIWAAMLATTAAAGTSALAQDAYIRLEAAPDAQAQAALSRWQEHFPEAVALDLPGRWTGIALGPLDVGQAVARYDALRASDSIPRDSFLTAADGRQPLGADALRAARAEAAKDGSAGNGSADSPDQTAPVTGTSPDTAPAPAQAMPADASAPDTPGADPEDMPQPQHPPAEAPPQPDASQPPATGDSAADSADASPAPAQDAATSDTTAAPDLPDGFIRLRALQTRDKADAELAALRQTLPGVSLFQLPSGWFALALGPLDQDSAAPWARTFKDSGLIAKDAFVTTRDDLGQELDAAPAPDLPAPDATAPMPPMAQVQQALRWGGYYDGAIDGKSGPQTRKAIAAAMGAERLSTDSGTAMQRLLEKRQNWRDRMGLETLQDAHTRLALIAPLNRVAHKQNKGPMAIYGPRDGSGTALILIADQGGRDRMAQLAGLVTALGWVPRAERQDGTGTITLRGSDDQHTARAELRRDGEQITGFVLIWPTAQSADAGRVAAEIADSLTLMPAPEPTTAPAPDAGSPAD
ncbi:peptidoglycan-binding domain-containing protein [Paracoccus jiaweipingae]|uniref:peptidoglycan-binding domain-containing protein n=1 Tax=unclassified Paracoccus (in: a-proteobacteria) TaxID=2688777 RepID=UPI0037BA7F82